MKGAAALDALLDALGRADEAALLLDYDGTLAPFRPERNKAVPYPGVRDLLQAIRDRTATRLVIVSGRALDDLLPLLRLDPPPEIWGSHGWERLDAAGERSLYPLTSRQLRALQGAWASLAEAQLQRFCERKPASVAVHWRGLGDGQAAALADAVRRLWQPFSSGQMLELHPFDGGLELRASGRTKATAVNDILTGRTAGRVTAFLGDDLTDEDGFRALRGRGLGILVRPRFRPTAAEVHLRPPRELLGFLADWLRRAPQRAVPRRGASR